MDDLIVFELVGDEDPPSIDSYELLADSSCHEKKVEQPSFEPIQKIDNFENFEKIENLDQIETNDQRNSVFIDNANISNNRANYILSKNDEKNNNNNLLDMSFNTDIHGNYDKNSFSSNNFLCNNQNNANNANICANQINVVVGNSNISNLTSIQKVTNEKTPLKHHIESDPLLAIPSPEQFLDKSSSSSAEQTETRLTPLLPPPTSRHLLTMVSAEEIVPISDEKPKHKVSNNDMNHHNTNSPNNQINNQINNQMNNKQMNNYNNNSDGSNVSKKSENGEKLNDNESQIPNENNDDSLIDFTEITISNLSPRGTGPPPQWITVTLSYITNLLALQPSIAIHRSKLFALYDSFRALLRNFNPDLTLPIAILKANCCTLIDSINKTRQIVYSCSASHWGQSAITWPTCTVKDSVRRLREDINDCLIAFKCVNSPNFIISAKELDAQDSVDSLQLKGSLLEYLNRISEQPQTPQIVQISELIAKHLNSIGPVDGIQEGPALLHITPFLPPRLNLVLTQDDFILGERIGSGTFGSVHRGTMTASGKPVAIKMLNAHLLGGRQLETFKREVWTMATLNHPSILHLIGVTLTAPFCIVTELLNCSLYDRLKHLTPTKRSVIALRVSQAMEQLHSARIIHRDLKSANILLDENDLPRVCDFGLVGFKTRGTRTGYVGTAQWMAPEILRSSPFYDEKVDVYSFAVLLWEMLTQQQPYKEMTQDQMVLAILENGLRPELSPETLDNAPPMLIDLIRRCWSEKPSDRPSFPQITATLFFPEAHFFGTDEEEFEKLTPRQLLSTNIVHAFDCQNWHRLDELLHEITPDQCKVDPELINIVISLFPNLDSQRQADIVQNLPRMVDIQQFLCFKGYSFICSLFSQTSIVVDTTVKMLRASVPLTSKGYRQVKLISIIASTKNEATLALCADLCEFEEIAKQIVDHDIPFKVNGMEIQLMRIYRSILKFPNLRSKVSELSQPIGIAAIAIHDDPVEVCECLSNFSFVMAHSDLIINFGLIPMLAGIIDKTPLALKILSRMFVICSLDELMEYKDIINELLEQHKQFFIDESIYLKLISLDVVENGPKIVITHQDEPL
ncbi:TKL family protein kinase [Tritrichomonas foetus]|uniref:TKL family protein kinase n=1 Tax=Tritrichomonas foetus TaxID=1144522 RepID=A0A1J4JHQ7_9EUKA|nr:TKL family protein kinase [Tritrichomonas foetus]|eukprot:OHS97147.1 TKL family protein kinase [Tritrichomonas foetus]